MCTVVLYQAASTEGHSVRCIIAPKISYIIRAGENNSTVTHSDTPNNLDRCSVSDLYILIRSDYILDIVARKTFRKQSYIDLSQLLERLSRSESNFFYAKIMSVVHIDHMAQQ